jgi:hypothetical protein
LGRAFCATHQDRSEGDASGFVNDDMACGYTLRQQHST